MPLDLKAFGALLAIFLLVAGTVVLSVTFALAARAIDRLWDAVSPSGDGGDGPDRREGQATRLRRAGGGGASRTVVALILLAALLAALAWLAFVRADTIGSGRLG
jgi:hypothetical protein